MILTQTLLMTHIGVTPTGQEKPPVTGRLEILKRSPIPQTKASLESEKSHYLYSQAHIYFFLFFKYFTR